MLATGSKVLMPTGSPCACLKAQRDYTTLTTRLTFWPAATLWRGMPYLSKGGSLQHALLGTTLSRAGWLEQTQEKASRISRTSCGGRTSPDALPVVQQAVRHLQDGRQHVTRGA